MFGEINANLRAVIDQNKQAKYKDMFIKDDQKLVNSLLRFEAKKSVQFKMKEIERHSIDTWIKEAPRDIIPMTVKTFLTGERDIRVENKFRERYYSDKKRNAKTKWLCECILCYFRFAVYKFGESNWKVDDSLLSLISILFESEDKNTIILEREKYAACTPTELFHHLILTRFNAPEKFQIDKMFSVLSSETMKQYVIHRKDVLEQNREADVFFDDKPDNDECKIWYKNIWQGETNQWKEKEMEETIYEVMEENVTVKEKDMSNVEKKDDGACCFNRKIYPTNIKKILKIGNDKLRERLSWYPVKQDDKQYWVARDLINKLICSGVKESKGDADKIKEYCANNKEEVKKKSKIETSKNKDMGNISGFIKGVVKGENEQKIIDLFKGMVGSEVNIKYKSGAVEFTVKIGEGT